MDCCISTGGIVRLTINGEVFSIRGSVNVMATNIERTEGANLDGSVFVTSKPVPQTVEMTVSDRCGLYLTTLHDYKCGDATIEMPEVGRTLALVNATVTGRPSLNPETGEISNFKLVGTRFRELHDETIG